MTKQERSLEAERLLGNELVQEAFGLVRAGVQQAFRDAKTPRECYNARLYMAACDNFEQVFQLSLKEGLAAAKRRQAELAENERAQTESESMEVFIANRARLQEAFDAEVEGAV